MICAFLGKQDFKHLLKWQMHTRKAFLPSPKIKSKATNTENYKEKGDADNHVLKEMEELSYAVECRKQQPKKLLAKTRAKDKIRKAAGMNTDATEDGYQDHELFSLASIKQEKKLPVVDSTKINDDNDGLQDNESGETQAAFHQEDISSMMII